MHTVYSTVLRLLLIYATDLSAVVRLLVPFSLRLNDGD